MTCKHKYLFVAIVAGPLVAPACAHLDGEAMTYEECASSKTCIIEGMASARLAEHSWMARFELPDGRCVSVSLPAAQLERLREQGPMKMSVKGRVYGDPSVDEEVASMQVGGRTIGLGLCGDFFVFVSD